MTRELLSSSVTVNDVTINLIIGSITHTPDGPVVELYTDIEHRVLEAYKLASRK